MALTARGCGDAAAVRTGERRGDGLRWRGGSRRRRGPEAEVVARGAVARGRTTEMGRRRGDGATNYFSVSYAMINTREKIEEVP